MRRGTRGLGVVLTGVALLLGSAAPGVAAPVHAADDQLDVRTASTYTLVPEAGVVRVVIDVTATNNAPNTTSGGGTTFVHFFDDIVLAAQPEATRVRATSGGSALSASVSPRQGFDELAIHLARSLYYHQTVRFRVAYDLPGGAPRSSSSVRVGRAYVTFVAWANGDVGSVRIVVPSSFAVTTAGSGLVEGRSGGNLVFTADAITETPTWYATIDADRASALTTEFVTIRPGQTLTVRGWPEDAAWVRRVKDLLRRGLPILDELVGLSWPVSGVLDVREVATPLLEGYAGIYHPDAGRIEISEELDDTTIIHEASHAWFNNSLFDERWIDEGLAETYAAKVLTTLGLPTDQPKRFQRSDRAAFALNDWPPLGRISSQQIERREQYGYATSFRVIQDMVRAAGDPAMRQIFLAASDHDNPYVGAGSPEQLPGQADWRALLDYLQEDAHIDSAEAEFRTWVVASGDLSALDARHAARTAYAQLISEGGDWMAPFAVRGPMAAWDFPTAKQRILDARAVLAIRDQIIADAAALGVAATPDLERAYEGASASLSSPHALADHELATLDTIAAASDRVAAERGPLEVIGLLGDDPAGSLAAAKADFAAGRLDDAKQESDALAATLDSASARGAQVVAAGGLLIIFASVGIAGAVVIRRRRGAAPPEPYTLASQSGPGTQTDGHEADQP